jgi:hypothetical protein
MEAEMAYEYTVLTFEGDGPFELPPPAGPIKVAIVEESTDLVFEWPLPPVQGQTQRILQLPVAPKYAMALMLVLKQAQKELGLEVPKAE